MCHSHIHETLCCPHLLPVSAQTSKVYLEGSLLWSKLYFAPSQLNLENPPLFHHILTITSLVCWRIKWELPICHDLGVPVKHPSLRRPATLLNIPTGHHPLKQGIESGCDKANEVWVA